MKETISTANMLLILSMDVLNDRLGLGYESDIKVQKKKIGLSKQ
jgi:hypothetical protein